MLDSVGRTSRRLLLALASRGSHGIAAAAAPARPFTLPLPFV